MIVSLDFETKPASGFEDYDKAALDHHRNEITQIAWACSDGTLGCFSGPTAVAELNEKLKEWKSKGAKIGGHNFVKFDIKTGIEKGINLTVDEVEWDTMVAAVAYPHKIPDKWLADYEEARVELNAKIKAVKGEKIDNEVHRKSGKHGLKTLAPYFLGVEPFWEAADHDDPEYAMRDALYTLKLKLKFDELLAEDERYLKFYNRIMRWARMLTRAELTGIKIDLEKLEKKTKESTELADINFRKLMELWGPGFETYQKLQVAEVEKEYEEMKARAVEKAKTEKSKGAAEFRYEILKKNALEKVEPFNMDSHAQLKWLLKDYFGFNIKTFEGDESTGEEVLQRLASEGHPEIQHLLEYKTHQKLSQAFFPSYKKMQWNGRIHTNFNMKPRTGRLSSDGPNMQQCPGDLHDLFIAGPGEKLICYDLANIEPILVAYVTECPELCDIVINGRSFHDTNTKIFFNLDCDDKDVKRLYKRERDGSKEFGLSLLYGAGPMRIKGSTQRSGFQFSEAECRQMHKKFKEKYKAVFEYKKHLDRQLERGEVIFSLLGRPYKIENREDVYMKGFNTFIQGSASDLLVEAATRAEEEYRQKGIKCSPLLLVHDELVQEADEDHAEAARDIYLKHLLGHKLETKWGTIPLLAEGGIFSVWKK